jgi:uncharacterized membrane protein
VKPALPAFAVALLAGAAVAIAPAPAAKTGEAVSFGRVKAVIDTRCLGCHAAAPTHPGFAAPPKGLAFDTPDEIARNSAKIAETVGTRTMPLANLTQMTDAERALVAAWYAQGAKR